MYSPRSVLRFLLMGLASLVAVACGFGPRAAPEVAYVRAHWRTESGALSAEPEWRKGEVVPPGGRPNPYGLAPAELSDSVRRGRRFALDYPVQTTGLQIPFATLERTFSPGPKPPALAIVRGAIRQQYGFDTLEGLEHWLGLAPYPNEEGTGAFFVPFAQGQRPAGAMGRTVFATPVSPGQSALTYSCAACHADSFFGRTILGMSTRFPRANDFFMAGAGAMHALPNPLMNEGLGIVRGDVPILRFLKTRTAAIEGVQPLALGLDTSLALVGLSLSRRTLGGSAALDPSLQRRPRDNPLRRAPADSKPAVWWNARYKNRWLSDGSVVSGNPLFTNILWNELGRGSDLDALAGWFDDHDEKLRDLTTAVFQAQAPTWFEVFGDRGIDLNEARRGALVYNRLCSRCHGSFDKAWDQPGWSHRDLMGLDPEAKAAAARTVLFRPLEQTPVIDVGTDPMRYLGMKGLVELNELDLSQRFGTVVVPQSGYVPPPLVGIFARYPYLHNNSVPSLCALLLPSADRPLSYVARAAVDPERDFDASCVGYPMGLAVPASPGSTISEYRVGGPGLSQLGHDEGIFLENGLNQLGSSDRLALIEYLKTL